MSKELSVSVCIATYNGESYIAEQIDSILAQLGNDDEIIVSDDGSTDKTKEIITDYMKKTNQIKLVCGPHDGFSKNFENAIINAEKDIILFSDQDDIWEKGKIEIIKKAFTDNPQISTILHGMCTFRNGKLVNTNEIKISYHSGVIRNFIKSSYWGCCMAVKREFIVLFLPFREHCVGHDQLIGLMTEKYGNVLFLNKNLLWHRLHGSNTSNKRTIIEMIVFRCELFKDYLRAKKQIVNNSNNMII